MWGGFPAEPDDLPQKQTPTPRPATDPDDHPGAAFPGTTLEDRCAHWLAARKSYREGLLSEADLDKITNAFDAALDAEFTALLRRS